MKIRRYTGSGVAIREAESVRSNVITSREAAGYQLSKMRARNQGLGALSRVADNEYARVQAAKSVPGFIEKNPNHFFMSGNKFRQALQEQVTLNREQAQITVLGASGTVDNAVNDIQNDPDAAKKAASDPTYYVETLKAARRDAQNQLASINDPILRETARQRLEMAGAIQDEQMRQWATGKQREGIVQESVSLFDGFIASRNPEGAMMAMQSVARLASPKVMATMQAELGRLQNALRVEAISKPILEAYRQEGVGAGDAMLATLAGSDLDAETLGQVRGVVEPARIELTRDEERAQRERAGTMSANYNELRVRASQGQAPDWPELRRLAAETDAFAKAGSPEAFDRAYSIHAQNAAAQNTRTEMSDLEADIRRVRQARLGWDGEMGHKAQKIVEQILAEETANMSPEDAANHTVEFVRSLGVLPRTSALLFNQAGVAADMLTEEAVTAWASLDTDIDTYVNSGQLTKRAGDILTRATYLMEFQGMNAAQAAQQTRDEYFTEDKMALRTARNFMEEGNGVEYREMREEKFREFANDPRYFDSGFFDFSGPDYNDLPELEKQEMRDVYNEAFDINFKAVGNEDVAHTAGMAAINSVFTLSNLGGGEIRLQRVPKEFQGDVSPINEAIMDNLRSGLADGTISIRAPGLNPDGEMITGERVDLDDHVVEIMPVNSSTLGPVDPNEVRVAVRVNGQLVRKEFTVEENGETFAVVEAREFSLPRGELRQMQATQKEREVIMQISEKLTEQLEQERAKLRGWQQFVPSGREDIGALQQQQVAKAEGIARHQREIDRLELLLEHQKEVLDGYKVSVEFDEPTAPAGAVEPDETPPAEVVEPEVETVTRDEIIAMIEATADEFGVPRELAIAQAEQESNFDPTAVSPAGYKGVFQLTEEFAMTPGGYGRGVETFPEGVSIFDPAQNIRTGISYLARLKREWGTWEKALRAYNWGPTSLSNHFSGVEGYENMPRETVEYPEKISNRMRKRFNIVLGDL